MVLENLQKYKVKLASNSPRRRELLSGLGIDYEIKVLPGIDETYPDTLSGEEIPVYIARESIPERHEGGRTDNHGRYHCVYRRGSVGKAGRRGRCVPDASQVIGKDASGHYGSVSDDICFPESFCFGDGSDFRVVE